MCLKKHLWTVFFFYHHWFFSPLIPGSSHGLCIDDLDIKSLLKEEEDQSNTLNEMTEANSDETDAQVS